MESDFESNVDEDEDFEVRHPPAASPANLKPLRLPPEIVSVIVDHIEDADHYAAMYGPIRDAATLPLKAAAVNLYRCARICRSFLRIARLRVWKRAKVIQRYDVPGLLDIFESRVTTHNWLTGRTESVLVSPGHLVDSFAIVLSPVHRNGIEPTQLRNLAEHMPNLKQLSLIFSGAPLDRDMRAAIESFDQVESIQLIANQSTDFLKVLDILTSFHNARDISFSGDFGDLGPLAEEDRTVMYPDEKHAVRHLADGLRSLNLTGLTIREGGIKRLNSMIRTGSEPSAQTGLRHLGLYYLAFVKDPPLIELVRAHHETLRSLVVIRTLLTRSDSGPSRLSRRFLYHAINEGEALQSGITPFHIPDPGPDGLLGNLCATFCPSLEYYVVGGPNCVSPAVFEKIGPECSHLELRACASERMKLGERDGLTTEQELIITARQPGVNAHQVVACLKAGLAPQLRKLTLESMGNRWKIDEDASESVRVVCRERGIEMGGQLAREDPEDEGLDAQAK